jgi:hypothetical protein
MEEGYVGQAYLLERTRIRVASVYTSALLKHLPLCSCYLASYLASAHQRSSTELQALCSKLGNLSLKPEVLS